MFARRKSRSDDKDDGDKVDGDKVDDGDKESSAQKASSTLVKEKDVSFNFPSLFEFCPFHPTPHALSYPLSADIPRHVSTTTSSMLALAPSLGTSVRECVCEASSELCEMTRIPNLSTHYKTYITSQHIPTACSSVWSVLYSMINATFT